MKTENKTEKAIINFSNYYHEHKLPINIIMIVVNVIMLIYYIPLAPFMTCANKCFYVLYEVFNVVNPFTIGAYFSGVMVLLQFIMYDGWFVKCLLSIFYIYVAGASLVVMLGMTSWLEAAMYIPHIIIIALCIAVTCIKVSYNKNNE